MANRSRDRWGKAWLPSGSISTPTVPSAYARLSVSDGDNRRSARLRDRDCVGARPYFAARPEPKSLQDLVNQSCVNFRQPSEGGLYAWEFEKRGRELKLRVDGQLVFSSMPPIGDAFKTR
jgi:hypothetical protein